VFWVISVYFNIRNTLPKSATFLLGHPVYKNVAIQYIIRSQWPRGLKLGSMASRLLGLRVRVLPAPVCLFPVNVVCCHVEVSASGRSLVQGSPAECVVFVCNLETSTTRWPRPE